MRSARPQPSAIAPPSSRRRSRPFRRSTSPSIGFLSETKCYPSRIVERAGASRMSNSNCMRRTLPLLVVVCSLCVCVSRASAQPFANAGSSVTKYTVAETVPAKGCESLSGFKGPDVVSITARVVAATPDTPQHCRVTGIISPEVAFEVSLPTQWNQRFYMVGNGGLAGDAMDTPTNADRTAALKNGFVIARTNTGHDSRKEPSGSFIVSNPQKATDYAYRAVHVTAEIAKK